MVRFPRSLSSRLALPAAAFAALFTPTALAHAQQTSFTSSSGISLGATQTTATSSSMTVNGIGSNYAVETVQVKLTDVTASGEIPYSSMGAAGFWLEAPNGTKFMLLGSTGDGVDGDDAGDSGSGLSNVTLSIEDGSSPAPYDSPWNHTGSYTVKPSSYFVANSGSSLQTLESQYGLPAASYPQTDGGATLDGTFAGINPNGTWTLYVQNFEGSTSPITVSSWTLNFTYQVTENLATTTSVAASPNPVNFSNSATFTATVSSTAPPSGTVTFTLNGSAISGCSGKAVSDSGNNGTAQCVVSGSAMGQGASTIGASFTPGTGFESSSASMTELVEATATQSSNTWCNTGSISVPNDGEPQTYPSIITVPSTAYTAGTTVGNVTVALDNVSGSGGIFGQFLLVAPGGGAHNLDFLDSAWQETSVSGVNLTMEDSDEGGSLLESADAPSTGSWEPYDNDNPGGSVYGFPTSIAPTIDSSVPQVPGTINDAPPRGSETETFGNNFNGAPAIGDWSLYATSVNGAPPITIAGGWCATFEINTGVATTATLTTSQPDQYTGDPVTFTATVKAGGSPVTSGGTVTFLDNGAAPAGTVSGNNVVTLNSSGVATFTANSLVQGDHQITAEYNGDESDNQSSSSLWQRIDNATVFSSSGNVINACNTGAISSATGNKGAYTPNPSNIFVANMPGTVNAVTLTLESYYTSSEEINETESLVEGPTGAALDYFSNTGSSSTVLSTPGNYLFSDSGTETVPDSSFSAGTYKPTSYANVNADADSFFSSESGLYTAPTTFGYAQPRGSSTLASTFGATDPNGTWSLYFDVLENAEAAGANNGWCLSFTDTLPTLTATTGHSGNFTQGQQNAQFTVSIENNGSGSTGDPVGTNPLTVTDTLNSNLTFASATGTGWSCSGTSTVTCTIDSAVAQGSDYPELTVNVNVSANAPASMQNSVSVSGGGAQSASSNTDTIDVDATPVITSALTTTFTVGSAGSFSITASGNPTPALSESGALPSGVTFTNNGNGTATLAGTPAAGTAGTYTFSITATNLQGSVTDNFTLNVQGSPAITSANSATFTAGRSGSFTVTSAAYPVATLSESGSLPSGVTFTNNGNGTATLAGTPAAGTGGAYSITITASNGISPNATQSFTLTVDQAPAITTASSTTFTAGIAGSFTVVGTGYPLPTFSETGALPSGVALSTSGVLSGTPGASTAGTYLLTITASNGVSPIATQSFTLTVNPPPNLVVTSTGDDSGTASNCTVQASTTTGTDSSCSLRDALLEAASLGAANIYFDSTKFASATTITLGSSGPLIIPTNTTVTGPTTGSGATLANLVTVSGNNQWTPFIVNFAATAVTIANLNIANGNYQTGGGPLTGIVVTNGGTGYTAPTVTITDSGGGTGSGATATATVSGGVITAIILTNSGENYSQPQIRVNDPTGTGATAVNSLGTGIYNAGSLTVAGSTVSGSTGAYGGGINSSGTLMVSNSTISGNSTFSGGGGIHNTGPVTVTSSTFSGNSTASGAGGIYDVSGSLTVTNSTFSGNSSQSTGGAISANGILTVTNSTFSNNFVLGAGGAIVTANSAMVNLSTFTHNTASTGGAISSSGTLTVTSSNYSSNSSDGGGGAISSSGTLTVTGSAFSGNSTGSVGGAMYSSGGMVTLTNSTFSGNSVLGAGGAFDVNGGTATVANSTFSGNSSTGGVGGTIGVGGGTVNVTNSILTGGSSLGPGAGIDNTGGTVNASYNVFYNNVASNIGPSPEESDCAGCNNANAIDANPSLSPLGNYGGPTQTMIPLPGSAAICAGLQADIPNGVTTDQRGEPNKNTSYPGYSAGTPCVDAGAVQTGYSMSFTAPVSSVTQNAAMSPAPSVTLDESGAPFTAAAVTIPLTLTSNPSGATLAGGSVSTSAGVATYSSLSVNQPGTGDQLTATLALNPNVDEPGTSTALALTSASSQFNVQAALPAVTQVSPATGPTTGGTVVTITGTNFTGVAAVNFGGSTAASFAVNSPTQITATSPAFASAETVDVTVTTASGASAMSPADQFTYFVPVATSFTPTVTPSTTFVYNNQPAISVAVSPAAATGTLTATLDGSTSLTVTPGSGGIFNIALPATPLTVGSHSIALAFTGTGVYEPTTGNISLTVTTPAFVVNTTTDDASGTASNCTGSPEGTCTLRDALAAAASADGANITFASSAFSAPGGATITLTNGTLTISSNTTIQGLTSGSGVSLANLVTVNGGGAANQSPVFTIPVTITGVVLANLNIVKGDNTGGPGGGIYGEDSVSFTVQQCTISGNQALEGAGIYSLGAVTIADSTISGNSTTGVGGGMFADVGTFSISGTAITGNSAVVGGGIAASSAIVSITGSTISGNTATSTSTTYGGGGITSGGVLNLANTIVAGNASAGVYPDLQAAAGGTLNNNGGNVLNSSESTTLNPSLALLGNYGGPTLTMIPLPGSPAICAGLKGNIPTGVTTDQRGEPNINTTYSGYTSGTPCVDAGAVQTNYSMSFTAPVSNVAPDVAMNPAPAVTLDESGSPFTAAAVTIPLTLTSIPSGATLSGGSVSTRAGVATYSSLSVNQPGTGDQLTAALVLDPALMPGPAISATSGTFSVSQLTPTLSFAPSPASQAYGTAITSASLDATATYNSANVAGTFAYTTTVNGNPVTLVAGTTVLPAGSYTITATFTPSASTVYNGSSTAASYTVSAVTLNITASSGSMTYGGAVPAITASYSGFVNGDSATLLTTQPTCSTTATSHSAVGSYPSSCTGAVDANYTISYTPGSVTVGQAALTITANNATRVYGAANPAFTGTISGEENGDTFAETFSTTATILSPAGGYVIVPSAAGANLADYTQSVTDGALTVTQAASITTLAASSTSITPGQSVTLTATVKSATTGTPTGTVNFYDNGTLLNATPVALSAGVATYSTAALTPGVTNTIIATYSGDANFFASNSNTYGGASIVVAPLDFTMTLSGPSNLTVVPGQSITYQVQVTPDYGSYAGPVSFAVSGLPPGATVTFSPSSISANSGEQTVTVTIQTAAATAARHDPPANGRKLAPFALAFVLLFGAGSLRKRGKMLRGLLCVLVLAAGGAAATMVSGCGGQAGFLTQMPENYTVVVTATAGSLQHTSTITLNVQ